MRLVPVPIMVMVSSNAYFRPTKSPILPNTKAPTGLTANPVAKVAKVSRNEAAGSLLGKNLLDKITAREPKI